MNVTLIAYTPSPCALAADAAAICTKSAHGIPSLVNAMSSGHDSVLEHASFTFRIEGVSRVLLAQLTRHRIASFSVQSQRYCGANLETVIPETMCDADLADDVVAVEKAVKELYNKAKEKGVPEEDIRYYTLQGGKTDLIMTMNARELRHFFALRCCNRAQWEIRGLADKMMELCKQAAPMLFADAGPGCVRGACPEARPCGKPRAEA